MKNKRAKYSCLALAIIAVAILGMAGSGLTNDAFPLRPYYPEVPFIGTDKLLDTYDEAIIVDIRSSFEYDVAHINKAALVPLTDKNFPEKLEKLRGKEAEELLVFYCNGHSCAKSYQAAQLSLSLGFENVFAYDGGIFDWISAAPEKATLMGETPARTNRIINIEEFKRHQMGFEELVEEAQLPNTMVIDIRDPFQRDKAPRINGIRNIPLDPLLDLVTSRIWTEKRLIFFDAVGKQVRWLQYFLESYGYYDYAFLEGGMRAIINDETKVKPVIETDRTINSNQMMLLKLTADQNLDNSDRKVVSYLLANIKFNNYVVIDLKVTDKAIGVSAPMLLKSVKKLSQLRYSTHSVMQNTLIVQVDPRLAWKGEQSGKLWSSKVKEFETAVKE